MTNETLNDLPPPAEQPSPAAKKSVSKLKYIAIGAAAAVIIGLAGGTAIGMAMRGGEVNELKSEVDDLNADVSTLTKRFENAEADREAAEQEIEGAHEVARETAESELADRVAELDDREEELAAVSEALDLRESEVTAAEIEKEDNQFGGGIHKVGESVNAGRYTTEVTSGMCYYAWMSGTGSDAQIIDNNIVSEGRAEVTLENGQIFESSGCGTWTK